MKKRIEEAQKTVRQYRDPSGPEFDSQLAPDMLSNDAAINATAKAVLRAVRDSNLWAEYVGTLMLDAAERTMSDVNPARVALLERGELTRMEVLRVVLSRFKNDKYAKLSQVRSLDLDVFVKGVVGGPFFDKAPSRLYHGMDSHLLQTDFARPIVQAHLGADTGRWYRYLASTPPSGPPFGPIFDFGVGFAGPTEIRMVLSPFLHNS